MQVDVWVQFTQRCQSYRYPNIWSKQVSQCLTSIIVYNLSYPMFFHVLSPYKIINRPSRNIPQPPSNPSTTWGVRLDQWSQARKRVAVAVYDSGCSGILSLIFIIYICIYVYIYICIYMHIHRYCNIVCIY